MKQFDAGKYLKKYSKVVRFVDQSRMHMYYKGCYEYTANFDKNSEVQNVVIEALRKKLSQSFLASLRHCQIF